MLLLFNISSFPRPFSSIPQLSLPGYNRLPALSSTYICGAQKDSQEFEVDPDKAREALKQLDQQLQSLSKKQVIAPKKKEPEMELDLNFERGDMRDTTPELSDTFLGYAAFWLVFFTVAYNVFFITVIQPAVDISSK